MVTIKEVTIGNKKDFVGDLAHLIKVGIYTPKGKHKFRVKGFKDYCEKEISLRIFRVAKRLGSNRAIIEEKCSPKSNLLEAVVSFYEEKERHYQQPEVYLGDDYI